MSFPGAFPVISVRRRASAPYWSMISSGSMPFPKDLLIFLPCGNHAPDHGSVHDGTALFRSARSQNTIRMTQKKMISYPVTSNIGRIEVIRISGKQKAFLWKRPSLRSHHSNKPGCGVPTRAVLRYTSHGYPLTSEGKSCQTIRNKFQFACFDCINCAGLPSHPS